MKSEIMDKIAKGSVGDEFKLQGTSWNKGKRGVWRATIRIIAIGGFLTLTAAGCAQIEMDCPQTGGETIAIGGSTVGNQIVALGLLAGQGAMKSGGLMAREGDVAPAKPTMHVHYAWSPIFGSDYVSCQATGGTGAPIPVAVVSTVKPPQ